ncbi:putative Ig domain-containing protein [Croceitalea marina]|uniref:Ig domain-containing protein n=1 Tax=Croceitalea marina TaxID=1775166 RepID=A0ABW5MU38_9FLAO
MLYAKSGADISTGVTDIWMLTKTDDSWGNPKKMTSPISSLSREASACMTLDNTIYFSSNRNCEGIENCYTADLFSSKLEGGTYQNTELIAELASASDEESVFISPKADFIIFCRFTNDKTWMDLYISYRDVNNDWIAPIMLDSSINSKDWDRRPFVTLDNSFLFFTRLQFEENTLVESDIYWVNTSKVFKPFVFNSLSDKILKVGEKFEIEVPSNYFKDINDELLTLELNQEDFDWLTFDAKQMKLSGVPSQEGDFELTFTATDTSLNNTEDKVVIRVVK